MKCSRYFSFALFALLGVFFGSFIINQNDTYAVDDITFTLNSNFALNTSICNEDSSVKCSDYKYMILQSNFDVSDLSNFTNSRGGTALSFWFLLEDPSSPGSGLGNYFSYSFWPNTYYVMSFSPYILSVKYNNNSISSYYSDWQVILTLTNSLGGPTPSGSLEITENGTYDVSNYAEAVVNVPEIDCPPGAGGNYHDDLVAINNSIIICAATCLVIYFFYCIYRMIIKNSGVK